MSKHSKQEALYYISSLHVRDYECDVQGIVNNAVYLNYLEYARNLVFWNKGLSLYDLQTMGESPVVANINIDYIKPLCARNMVYIATHVERKGVFKLMFYQKIITQLENTNNSTNKNTDNSICNISKIQFAQQNTSNKETNSLHFLDKDSMQAYIDASLLHTKASVAVAVLQDKHPALIEHTQLYTSLFRE